MVPSGNQLCEELAVSETQQQPSTEWVEVVSPDEERRHKQFAETIVEIQSKIDRKNGPGRAFHRKEVLAARAVVVLDENNRVLHSQLVGEIKDEPDYAAALAALA